MGLREDGEKIVQLLEELGTNTYDIAVKLRDLKVRGRRRSSSSCPIAVYLWSKGFLVRVGSRSLYALDGSVIHSTPPQICDLIVEFDLGRWPTLEA